MYLEPQAGYGFGLEFLAYDPRALWAGASWSRLEAPMLRLMNCLSVPRGSTYLNNGYLAQSRLTIFNIEIQSPHLVLGPLGAEYEHHSGVVSNRDKSLYTRRFLGTLAQPAAAVPD